MPRRTSTGRRNRLIAIEAPTAGAPNDSGEATESWPEIAQGYFAITAKAASEAWRDSQPAETADYVFEGLYSAAVIAAGGQCRLQLDTGETWHLVGAIDPDGCRRNMVMFARAGTA